MQEKQNSRSAFYEELNFRDDHLASALTVDRRNFIKLLGGGIVLLFSIPQAQAFQRGRGRQLPDDFNAFLRIGEDGKITGFTGKIEMGQGVYTSLAQTLADELDVALASVEMIMGDTDLCPWDMGTFGSMTTRFFGPAFRQAAAEAKALLIEMAAEKLRVPKERLKTKEGVVYEAEGELRVTYAELAKGEKIVRRLEGEALVEKPTDFTIIGKPVTRLDAVEKITGNARFSGDVTRPGMLYARLLRPPAHGSRPSSVDASEARRLKGVRVVEEGDLIAVLHELPDLAEEALNGIKVRYERPLSGPDEKTIFDHLLRNAPEGETVARGGDLRTGEESAEVFAEETYLNSYVAHAPMEPHTAVAEIQGNRATLWASTQTPFGLKEEAAAELSVPPENIRVRPPFVGGGFGGKTSNRQAIEALRLAKLTGKPVQVAWSREEEFFHDTFRPAAVVKIRAGATRAGRVVHWDYRVYCAGERGSRQFYDIPNHRTDVFGSGWRGSSGVHPLATGAWRAPANNTNTFARESHIDILASKLEIDPLEFRILNLKDEKMKRVLQAAGEKFGWKPVKAPSGRGVGIALGIDAGTYVAHIAEVEVDEKTGKTQVKRVVCAQDMGLCVNPEGARIQMEGCITMGLGYALTEEIRFKSGEILDTNFDTYKIPRFSWLPEIETVIIDAVDSPPQGGGEPAIICMGAVLANAIFDATGARLFQLPMTPERMRAALG